MTTEPSLRRRERALDGSHEALEIARLGLGDDAHACRPGRPRRLWAEGHGGRRGREAAVRAGGRGGRQSHRGRSRGRPPGSARRSGRGRPRRLRSASGSSWRAPSAPANSTFPAGVGMAARSPSWVDGAPTRSAPPNASAVAFPIAATRRGMPRIRRRSSRAPVTLVTTTQSYPLTSTGSSPSSSMATSGTWTTSARPPPGAGRAAVALPDGRVTTILGQRAVLVPSLAPTHPRGHRDYRRRCDVSVPDVCRLPHRELEGGAGAGSSGSVRALTR